MEYYRCGKMNFYIKTNNSVAIDLINLLPKIDKSIHISSSLQAEPQFLEKLENSYIDESPLIDLAPLDNDIEVIDTVTLDDRIFTLNEIVERNVTVEDIDLPSFEQNLFVKAKFPNYTEAQKERFDIHFKQIHKSFTSGKSFSKITPQWWDYLLNKICKPEYKKDLQDTVQDLITYTLYNQNKINSYVRYNLDTNDYEYYKASYDWLHLYSKKEII